MKVSLDGGSHPKGLIDRILKRGEGRARETGKMQGVLIFLFQSAGGGGKIFAKKCSINWNSQSGWSLGTLGAKTPGPT